MDHHCRQATVSAIKDNKITVVFKRPEACSECAAKNICNQANSAQNIIEFETQEAAQYHIGQSVKLELEQPNAFLSILLAFGLPLVLMLIPLFGLLFFQYNETFAALLSLLTLAIYYLILFAFRNRLKEKIKIKLTTL